MTEIGHDTYDELKQQGIGWKCVNIFLQINIVLLFLFGVFITLCSFVIAGYGFNNDVMGLQGGFIGIGIFGLFCIIDSVVLAFAMQKPKHAWHVFMFGVGLLVVVIIGLIFIVTGSFIVGRGEQYVDKMTSSKCKYSKPALEFDQFLYLGEQLYTEMQKPSNGTFCSRQDCACAIDNSTKKAVIKAQPGYASYKFYTGALGSYKLINKLPNCNVIWNKDAHVANYSRSLQFIMFYFENAFSCAGFCTKVPLYMFTDVNKSPAKRTCLKPVAASFHHNKNIVGIISIIFGIYVFLTMILCGKVLHNKKKDNDTEEAHRD